MNMQKSISTQLSKDEKFAYWLWCARERHRRGQMPLRGKLVSIGDPTDKQWHNREAAYFQRLARYKQPEITLPACAIGLFFLIDLTPLAKRPRGTFVKIAQRAGLTWEATAGLIALNDGGADWQTIADAAVEFKGMPEMTARSALGSVMQKLHNTVPGYNVGKGIWGAQMAFNMCEATGTDPYEFVPQHILEAHAKKRKAVDEMTKEAALAKKQLPASITNLLEEESKLPSMPPALYPCA